MDKMASWKAKQEEEAKKRREAPEARQLTNEAARLLDDAANKLCAAGAFELMDRVVFLYGVLLGFEELEDLQPRTTFLLLCTRNARRCTPGSMGSGHWAYRALWGCSVADGEG